jgi:hypothetical protein
MALVDDRSPGRTAPWLSFEATIESKLKLPGRVLTVVILIAALFASSKANAENAFNPANAPLDLTVEQLQSRYPQCILDHGQNYLRNAPFTGYEPTFRELTPNYEGRYLEGVEDDLSYYDLDCGNGSFVHLTFFSDKSIVATKNMSQAGSDALGVIGRMRASLTGIPGPLHQAVGDAFNEYSPNQPVFVTYADDGDLRTVVEVEANHSDDSLMIIVAYVDTPLWSAYSKARVAKVKSYLRERGTQQRDAVGNP